MGDVIEFRWDARRLKWSAGLLLLVAALGIPMLLEADPGVKVLGAVWLAMFTWCVWALLRRTSDRAPVVTLSAAGLCDRRIMEPPVPWAAISRIEALDAEHVPFIGLEFHDPKATLAGARPLVRLSAPLHRLLRFPSASMQMSLLDGNRDDLVAAIRRFAPELVVPSSA